MESIAELTIKEDVVCLKEADELYAFRLASGRRNIGMPYWLLDDRDTAYIHLISDATDRVWLSDQIEAGKIYIRKCDYQAYRATKENN